MRRPDSRWEVFVYHAPGLAIGGLLLLASSALRPGWLPSPLCLFLRLTGYPCPFCGSTRTFVAMGHGHFAEAWRQSPLGVLLYAGCVALVVWSLVAMAANRIIYPGERWYRGRGGRLAWLIALAVAVLANWIYRVSSGLR